MNYRIKTVAALTGISPTTLRAWERRYDLVEPQRTLSGYRIYSGEEIETLTRIKALVDKGFKAGEAIELVRGAVTEPTPADLPSHELAQLSSDLLDALLSLDRPGAAESYSTLVALPLDRQVDEVLLPMLGRVGELWQDGRCSVAQEHFCSAFVREKLVGMLAAINGGPAEGREVVCAGLPGEPHEFGLMAAAIHLAMRGWRVTYLGADLPVESLEGLLAKRRPAMLVSSLITRRPRADCLAIAAALRAAAPPETAVVLGGAGLATDLPRQEGERLYLLRELSELFELPPVDAN